MMVGWEVGGGGWGGELSPKPQRVTIRLDGGKEESKNTTVQQPARLSTNRNAHIAMQSPILEQTVCTYLSQRPEGVCALQSFSKYVGCGNLACTLPYWLRMYDGRKADFAASFCELPDSSCFPLSFARSAGNR